MTKDEICGLLRQIHDVLAMQSETNFVPQQPTPAEYAMGYAEGFNDACKPKQGEPVAWMSPSWIDPDTRGWQSDSFESIPIEGWLPIYTTPPQRPWVGLTEEEVELYWDWEDFQTGAGRSTIFEMVRDIETKLREKNNA